MKEQTPINRRGFLYLTAVVAGAFAGGAIFEGNTLPLNKIIFAIEHRNEEINDLTFPKKYTENNGNWYTIHQEPLPVKLDDLAYLIRNLEPLCRDANRDN